MLPTKSWGKLRQVKESLSGLGAFGDPLLAPLSGEVRERF